MWEYLHNSNNSCFSYEDEIKKSLDQAIYENDIAIPKILSVISENSGILQRKIYPLLPDIEKSEVQRILRKLEHDNIIIRTKKSNTYEPHINS